MKRLLTYEQFRALMALLLGGLFIGLLWLPTLDIFFGLDKAPHPAEKRAPAKFPRFEPSLEGVRLFISGLDAYYSDHFGFRKRLIRWERRWKRDLFKESGMPDVIVGHDGWLYYTANSMIDHHRATAVFTEADLKDWQVLLESRRDWCAERNIHYLFVIVPDKHSVYPEHLPDWMSRVGPATKVEQLVAYLREHSTVEVLDLRPPLIEAKKTNRTFLYTDTHWTWYGAFIGYQNLVRSLAKLLPGLEPLPLESFEWNTLPLQPGGDLATMLNQKDSLPEKDRIDFRPKAFLPPIRILTETNLLGKRWAPGAEPMITENPAAQGKVILFRDSFAGGWGQFLAYHFRKSIYIWQYNWDKEFVEKEKPEVVIDEILERFLNTISPKELKAKDGQRGATMASHK